MVPRLTGLNVRFAHDHDVTSQSKMGGRSRISPVVRDPVLKRTLPLGSIDPTGPRHQYIYLQATQRRLQFPAFSICANTAAVGQQSTFSPLLF
jgi:hypothetical protein